MVDLGSPVFMHIGERQAKTIFVCGHGKISSWQFHTSVAGITITGIWNEGKTAYVMDWPRISLGCFCCRRDMVDVTFAIIVGWAVVRSSGLTVILEKKVIGNWVDAHKLPFMTFLSERLQDYGIWHVLPKAYSGFEKLDVLRNLICHCTIITNDKPFSGTLCMLFTWSWAPCFGKLTVCAIWLRRWARVPCGRFSALHSSPRRPG